MQLTEHQKKCSGRARALLSVALLGLTMAWFYASASTLAGPTSDDNETQKEAEAARSNREDAKSSAVAHCDSMSYLSREDVRGLLQELSRSIPPEDLSRGGCLRVKMPPDTVVYVCPVCQGSTSYTDASLRLFIWDELPECREIVENVTVLDLRLNERSFCHKCRSDTSPPELCFSLSYLGESQRHETCGVGYNQAALVSELLSGKNKHRDRNGREIPLKWYLKRLEDLVGIATYPDSAQAEKGQ